MTRILCSLALISLAAWADETADRIAIHGVIASLNINLASRTTADANLFTADADGRAVLDELHVGEPALVVPQFPAPPTVIISHDPWGEATIWPRIEFQNVIIVSRAVRFITSDVAIVDASAQRIRLLFVIRK